MARERRRGDSIHGSMDPRALSISNIHGYRPLLTSQYLTTIASAIPADVYAEYCESVKQDNSLASLLDISRDLVRGGFPEPTDGVYRVLCMFLRRSWFHRIWTVQECVLPSKGQVWYGSHRITDMGSFSRIELIARTYIEPLPMPAFGYSQTVATALEYLRNFLFSDVPGDGSISFLSGGITLNVSDCLFYSRDKKCAVPHDHVYAILGLQGDQLAQADYKITVQELYTKVALHPSIQPFAFENAGLGTRKELEKLSRNENLPSWVPDWNSPLDFKAWFNHHPRATFHAGGLHPEEFSVTQISDGAIRVAGFIEDRVILLGGNGSPINPQSVISCLRLLDAASAGAQPVLDANNMVERLARTLTLNTKDAMENIRSSFRAYTIAQLAYHLYDHKDDAEWDSVRSMIENLLERDATATGFLPTWPETEKAAQWVLREVQDSYALALSNNFTSRRFFITDKGRMGLAAGGTAVNDAIVIVRDYEYPLMMREGHGACCQLVSQAYVEGIMHGEVLESRVFEDIDIE